MPFSIYSYSIYVCIYVSYGNKTTTIEYNRRGIITMHRERIENQETRNKNNQQTNNN